MTLSDNLISELSWWINNIGQHAYRYITTIKSDQSIHTDASFIGWGVTDNDHPSGGFWHNEESRHINVLELMIIFYGIKTS